MLKAVVSSVIIFSFVMLLTGCESLGGGSENNLPASASPIPWNKPASWEGAGALGGLGFQGTH